MDKTKACFIFYIYSLKDYNNNNKNIKHLISCYLQVTNNNGNTEDLDHGSQTSFNTAREILKESIKHDQQINIKPAKINCNTSAEINEYKEFF
ncbi:10066_t:CDS:2 [Entrophospora sp. SA101]|nr:13877_t:CDS:2 [Entrophospora sp. SA101]CAJ0825023.1 10066_t:CDS:2 [Entrophospora sp. SA101]